MSSMCWGQGAINFLLKRTSQALPDAPRSMRSGCLVCLLGYESPQQFRGLSHDSPAAPHGAANRGALARESVLDAVALMA